MIEMHVVARAAFRVALVASTALLPVPALAAAVTWDNPALGDWFNPANWIGGVPTTADDATVNNGGTAAASGLLTPSARSLFIGSGNAAVQTGTVTVTGLDLQIGNVFNALRVGAAGAAGATATGTLDVGGSVLGLAAGTPFSAFVVGSASGASAVGNGSMTVGGDVVASGGSVGVVGSGDGSAATGTLTVQGSVSGVTAVGFNFNAPGGGAASTATGSVVATNGDITVSANQPLSVGVAFGAGMAADGSMTAASGTLRTAAGFGGPQFWSIGTGGNGATATGTVSAGAVDTTAQAVGGLFVGTAANGGTGTGALTLGSGTLTVDGNASIGTAQIDQGGTANGAVTLGGTLAAAGTNRALDIGQASSSSLFAPGTGSAAGALTAEGIAGFRSVDIGIGAANQGQNVTASGTATIGAGGIVNEADPGGTLRIGAATGVLNNFQLVGPGPVVTGTATVAGDVSGYANVQIGAVTNTGTASGSLALTNGTLTTSVLTIGFADGTGGSGTLVNAATNATGTLGVTDGAVVIAPPQGFGAGLTRIGATQFADPAISNSATGTLALTRSSFTGGNMFVGLGGDGIVTAVQGSSIDIDFLALASGGGSAAMTLNSSSLAVGSDPNVAFGNMVVGIGGTAQATASTITIGGALTIGTDGNSASTGLARVALAGGSTLDVGGNVAIGGFWPNNRAELALTDSTATVDGNLRLSQSANVGQLFGEAQLALSASLLDIVGDLTMDFGAETLFGIEGLARGLGGYGAIDAASATLLGLITIDFTGLADDLGFAFAAFDLISVTNGFIGDFDQVSLLSLPTGYLVSYGRESVGEGDVWRVTLTQVQAVPEPGAMGLLLAGLMGLVLLRWRPAASAL